MNIEIEIADIKSSVLTVWWDVLHLLSTNYTTIKDVTIIRKNRM